MSRLNTEGRVTVDVTTTTVQQCNTFLCLAELLGERRNLARLELTRRDRRVTKDILVFRQTKTLIGGSSEELVVLGNQWDADDSHTS